MRLITTIRSLMLGGCLAWTVPGAFGFQPPSRPPLPDFDQRRKLSQEEAAQPLRLAPAQALSREMPGVRVEYDRLLGAPKSVRAVDGFLTGPNGKGRSVSAPAAVDLASNVTHRSTRAFLREHRALFGHGDEVLAKARISREFVTPHNGLRTVVWQQEVDNIPVFESLLVSHETRHGELVNLSSQLLAQPEEAARRAPGKRAAGRLEPALSALEALSRAARNLGETVAPADIAPLDPQPQGPERRQRFKSPLLKGDALARLTWLPMTADQMRLCWDLVLSSSTRGEMFRVLVDAQTGEVLVRRCLTRHIGEATYRVYTGDSPSPLSPGHAVPMPYQPPLVGRSLVTWSALNTNASPAGWISEGENETRGNNVDAHTDWNSDDLPDLPRPQGTPFRVFDFPLDLRQDPRTYHEAAVVQMFYWCNWAHDRLYELGFTEAAGNFQAVNFGRGGLENDPLQADAQDGATTDNASMSVPPDGLSPRLEMHLFTGPTPHRDSAFDTEVLLHEYVHGLTERTAGGGVGLIALQSWGLGEGWSDFYSLALLSEPGDDLDGNYTEGGYVTYLLDGMTENYYYGIRRYPYSTDLSRNPLTFKDIDPTQASPHPDVPLSPLFRPFRNIDAEEVHNQGEVWCAMLWEARANLIRKHGFATGNQLILQLVTDGLRLTPINPNFVHARDGILQADWVNHGGSHLRDLWAAFAKRGLGVHATAPDSATTVGLRESFEVPGDLLVVPNAGPWPQGPVGGPFSPSAFIFQLTQTGTSSIPWSAHVEVPWLSVSPSEGILVPGGPAATVTVLLDPTTSRLPAGFYTNVVWFTNRATGVGERRAVVLRVGSTDFLTERFDADDNDLSFQSFTFTPDGSPNFYLVCRSPITELPTDPLGGTEVWLSDDSFFRVTLSGNHAVALFGMQTNVFFVSANGCLTLRQGDPEWLETRENHFRLQRISALFDDFDPETSGGGVSWRELEDRVAVTYLNVQEFDRPSDNTFQIEWFYDGRIRLSYLKVEAEDGLVGLSRGTGVPAGFTESDFGGYLACLPALRLTLPATATEGSGILPGQGTVAVAAPLPTNLTVQLISSVPTDLTVPAQVTIMAGATSAVFPLTLGDDGLLDGAQQPVVTALAAGFTEGRASMLVLDNESATLQVDLPVATTEGAGLVQGAVRLSAVPDRSLFVQLFSSDGSAVQAEPFVIIPAGQTSTVFRASVVDDTKFNGDRSVTITARVPGWAEGMATLTIHDNEPRTLELVLPAEVVEGQGLRAGAGAVRLPGTLPTNLVVSLASMDPTEVACPSSVTILAGQTWAPFDLAVLDDGAPDGPQPAAIVAAAPNFGSATNTLTVHDDQSPLPPANPTPTHCAGAVSIQANLSWSTGTLNAIMNGGFEAGELMGWTGQESGDGDVHVVRGVVQPFPEDPPAWPYAGDCSVLARIEGTGRTVLQQEVTLPAHATSAVLQWADRIRTRQVQAGNRHVYQVEIRDTNDTVLQVAFSTPLEEEQAAQWTGRTFDLRDHLGQTLRIAFIVESQAGEVSVNLDEIRVDLKWGNSSAYDVYFGQNPTPGPAEYLGRTTSTTWPLPPLASGTTYYWQVVAQGDGTAAGPVWQFTTRAVDHFDWGAIASPQQATQPFVVEITARDELGGAATNFAGPVTLSGVLNYRTPLFREGFEDGALAGWQSSGGPQVAQVTNETAARGRSSLSISGGNYRDYEGLWRSLGGGVPERINFHVRTGASDADGGHLVLADGSRSAVVFALNHGTMGLRESGGWHAVPFQTDRWYQVTLVLDWSQGTVDYFVDGALAVAGIPFNQKVSSLSTLYLYNREPVQCWWDEIEFASGPAPVAVPVAPTVSGSFTNGVWAGALAALQPAHELRLVADDLNGHTGVSGPFDVLAWNEVTLAMTGSPASVAAGEPVTFSLVISNSGPASASGVVVTSTLPAHATFAAGTSSLGGFTVSGQSVVFSLGTLDAGGVANLQVVTVPSATLAVTNVAHVTREGAPCCGENGTAVTSVAVWPTVSIGDLTVVEGNVGTNEAAFGVTLSSPTDHPVIVDYVPSVGSALGGLDYLVAADSLVILPGQTSNSISVQIIGDTLIEFDEDFFLDLTVASGAFLAKGHGVGNILDDDGLPGDVCSLEWSLILSPQEAGRPFAVQLTARDAFGEVATHFNDSVAITATGQALGLLPVGAENDAALFPVNTSQCAQRAQVIYLASEIGRAGRIGSLALNVAELPGQALTGWTVRMKHTSLGHYDAASWDWNDSWTEVCQTNLSITATGWVTCLFSTPFDYNGTDNLIVDFSFNNGSASAGGLCRAFHASASRTLTFATCEDYDLPTDWAWNLPMPELSDRVPALQLGMAEPASTAIQPQVAGPFTQGVWIGELTVVNPAGAVTLSADDGQGHHAVSSAFDVLATDDLSLTMTGTPAPVRVGEELEYTLVVLNSGPSMAEDVVVTNFLPQSARFVSASASQGDFSQAGGTIVFQFGTLGPGTSAALTVRAAPLGSGPLTNRATAARRGLENHLQNNDVALVTDALPPCVSVEDVSVVEGNAGAQDVLIPVRLSAPTTEPVTVHYRSRTGTGTHLADYMLANGVLTFPPGVIETSIVARVASDRLYEMEETFEVVLTAPASSNLCRASAVVTIIDDDPPPALSIDDVTLAEGDAGMTAAVFVVYLDSPAGRPVEVAFSTVDSTALAGTDYEAVAGTVELPAGTTRGEIVVPVFGDLLVEGDERFFVRLSQPTNATIARAQATATLRNDDGPPGQLAWFEWTPIPSPQYAGQPFAVTLTARDVNGAPMPGFNGSVALRAEHSFAWSREVGSDLPGTCIFPIHSIWGTERTQVIYRPDEIGAAGRITRLALEVVESPGQMLNRWTVRLKHTPLAEYQGDLWWEANGWTTVLQTNVVIAQPGWVDFSFTTPFDYDGVGNLMIDFSFISASGGGMGFCRGTVRGTVRTLYYDGSYSSVGDPLRWSEGYPFPHADQVTPNLKLQFEAQDTNAIQPAATAPFANGSWSGELTLADPGTNFILIASDPAGHTGVVGPVTVIPWTDHDGDGLPDDWEIHCFGSTDAAPNDDPDDDGISNLGEFRAGTDPANSSDVLRIISIEATGTEVRIRFASAPAKQYRLEWSDSTAGPVWITVRDDLVGSGDVLEVSDPGASGQVNRFYRVRLLP